MAIDSTTAQNVSKHLDAVEYPADKAEIMSEISSQVPEAGVIEALEQLPDRRYSSRAEVATFFETLAVYDDSSADDTLDEAA